MNNNKKMVSRLLSGITLVALLMAMSVTGALGGFFRTLDGLTDTGVPNPLEFLFGYGVDENGDFGYGYGYGYGNGDIDDGESGFEADGSSSSTSSSSSSGGSGSSSSSGGSGSSSSSSSSGGSGSSSSSSSSSSGGSGSSSSSSSSSGGGGGGGGGGSSSGFTSTNTSTDDTDSDTTVDDNVDNKEVVNIDTDKYLLQLQAIRDLLNAEPTTEVEQVPAPGLQLPSILPQTGTSAAAKGIQTFTHATVDTTAPTWVRPTSLANASTDASYWINTIPYEQDRNANSYVVIPTSGVVAPINASSAEEAAKAISGQSYNYSIPLQTGAAHYPGTQQPGQVGTSVIFGHSSDYVANAGRYKTLFGKIIELDLGEEVWVYTRNLNGGYDRMRFLVETSREISPSKTDILLPQSGKNLSLFTCTPIGGITGRWHVNATLIEDTVATESAFDFSNLSFNHKVKINVAMNKYAVALNSRTEEEKNLILATFAFRIEQMETRFSGNQYASDLLLYIKVKLAEML